MGERAKIMLNEYTAKALLKRDDLDLDKFDSTDIKMMVKVAQQELKKKDNIITELEKWCNECIDNHIIARENGVTTISDTFFEIVLDKLKTLKENNK